MRKSFLLFCMVLLIGSLAQAQGTPKSKGATAKSTASTATGTPDRALAQKVCDAWSSMDPGNAAPYYDKDAHAMFFDMTPLKYTGWAEYDQGARKVLADLQSLKFTLNPDLQFHRAGPSTVWLDGTMQTDMAMKDGTKQTIPTRWTAVWEKKGNQWLIVHEHVSAPVTLPEKK